MFIIISVEVMPKDLTKLIVVEVIYPEPLPPLRVDSLTATRGIAKLE